MPLTEYFRFLDLEEKGYISARCLQTALTENNVFCDDTDLKCLMKLFRKKVDERISVHEFVAFLDLWNILKHFILAIFKCQKCNITLLCWRKATRQGSCNYGGPLPNHKPMRCDSVSIFSLSWKEDWYQIGPLSNISITSFCLQLRNEWCWNLRLPWRPTMLWPKKPSTSNNLYFCWMSSANIGTTTTRTIRIKYTINCLARRPRSKKTQLFTREWCRWRKSTEKWPWRTLFRP